MKCRFCGGHMNKDGFADDKISKIRRFKCESCDSTYMETMNFKDMQGKQVWTLPRKVRYSAYHHPEFVPQEDDFDGNV